MKTLTLDKLLGALRVHEVYLFKRDKIKDNNIMVLKAENTKHKRVENLDKRSSGLIDDEISLMSRRFKKRSIRTIPRTTNVRNTPKMKIGRLYALNTRNLDTSKKNVPSLRKDVERP
ncbi:hypothetical protein CR513_27395, partial [Mucuna pruriens]